MSSLTRHLDDVIRDRRRGADPSYRDEDDDVLFSRGKSKRGPNPSHPSIDDDDDDDDDELTYGECLDIVSDHGRWLVDAIRSQLYPRKYDDNDDDDEEEEEVDVVIGYMSDNSPDLLLSVLACVDLTLDISWRIEPSNNIDATNANRDEKRTTKWRRTRLIPAMMHCRWTPMEVEMALRPLDRRGLEDDDIDDIDDGRSDARRHVTMILYGPGYEITATDAARSMTNRSGHRHSAMAEPLPGLAAGRRWERRRTPTPPPRVVDLRDRRRHPVEDASSSLSSSSFSDGIGAVSDADALVIFTSGTTSGDGGAGRGVRLSHRSILVQSRAKTMHPCSYDDKTRLVATTVPWFHVGGMSSAIAVMLAGGALVFPGTSGGASGVPGSTGVGKFRPEEMITTLLPTSSTSPAAVANTLVVVPAMLHSMLECASSRLRCENAPDHPSSSSLPNVRLVLVGGQSIVGYGGVGLYDRTRVLFPNARVVQTYACTEAGSSMTFEELTSGCVGSCGCGMDRRETPRTAEVVDDGRAVHIDEASPPSHATPAIVAPGTCVGYPPPHVRIGIFHPDEAAGAVARARPYAPRLPEQLLLPNGTTGIIGTRGPHVMSGYWSRGAIVRVGDDGGGWVLTNDLGYIHTVSGKLYFRGRADDVIRTGGESVLAADVERVILDLTSPTDDDSDNANDNEKHTIVECSVFPLPDEKFGEAVCAAVVLSSKGKAAPALVEGGTASASWDTASTNTLVGDGNNDSTPSAEENEQLLERIRRFCVERQLASFKHPRRVFIMQALPLNPGGKVLKHDIIKICASKTKKLSRL